MTKRILLAVLLVLALGVTAFAEPAQLTVTVDGAQSEAPLACVEIDGVMYTPVADLAAMLGYNAELTDTAVNFTTATGIDPYFAELIGTWHLYDGSGIYMTFNADGTGVAGGATPDVMTVHFDWSAADGIVTMKYTSVSVGTIVLYEYIYDEFGNAVMRYSENPDRKFYRGEETTAAAEEEPELTGMWSTSLTGMWSTSLKDTMCKLELRDDGAGVMTVGTTVYRFVWSADGNNLSLVQNEIELKGVYNPDTGVLTVALGDLNLEFIR